MKIHDPAAYQTATELDIIERNLPLQGQQVLELGCGRAWMTRQLAEHFQPEQIIATEVDQIQHAKNGQINDLPQVKFCYGGAQAIDLPDQSIDAVLMLKSLHHVPLELMQKALQEVARVLRPGGLAYISEPVYWGDFNDILKLFHDEAKVRQAAFEAIQTCIESKQLKLERQIFFNAPGHYEDFDEFDQRMIQVTHTDHQITPTLYSQIKQAFERHMGDNGADFLKPSRVDLLRKPIGPSTLRNS